MDDYVTRDSSVASVYSEKKASTNSDIVSPSSAHIAKMLGVDDEGISYLYYSSIPTFSRIMFIPLIDYEFECPQLK